MTAGANNSADIGHVGQEFVPLSSVPVKILLPKGRNLKSVRFARAGCSAPSTLRDEFGVVAISAPHAAEIVHVEMGKTMHEAKRKGSRFPAETSLPGAPIRIVFETVGPRF